MIMYHFKGLRVHVILILNDILFFSLSGGFAFVYEAQDMSSGKDYALKVRKRCPY